MIKNFIGGMCVGIANIIPGVSGGTILVILGLFNQVMDEISNIFNTKSTLKEKFKSCLFILQILIGVGIGLVVFAKILTYLFVHFELQTISLFAGFIILSLPMLKREEMKNTKINYLFFIIGLLFILIISLLSNGDNVNIVSLETLLNKDLTIFYLLLLVVLGFIGGATMIFPGVSGSMILLVLGWYHLFKSYVANITTFSLKIYIPLLFIGIGVLLGIVISAKVTNYLLKKKKRNTMSLILGLILASSIVIFPTNKELYNVFNVLTSIITFILGGSLIMLLEYLKKKKAN